MKLIKIYICLKWESWTQVWHLSIKQLLFKILHILCHCGAMFVSKSTIPLIFSLAQLIIYFFLKNCCLKVRYRELKIRKDALYLSHTKHKNQFIFGMSRLMDNLISLTEDKKKDQFIPNIFYQTIPHREYNYFITMKLSH